MTAPPVAERARALGLDLEQPESVNGPRSVVRIAHARPDAVVVCAFGALIKDPLLSEHELLNVHPSLLPRWRGAAPIERAIMAGDERTGVSIMRLTAGLDSGPVCRTAAVPIDPADTYGSLSARLRELGGVLLVATLDLVASGLAPAFAEQDETGVSYAEKLGPADRLLDPSKPASELERVVRALHPHIGARVALADGTLLGVHRARVVAPDTADQTPPSARDHARHGGKQRPGPVIASDNRLLLNCHTGVLELLEVQPSGGRPMDASAYLRGHASALK